MRVAAIVTLLVLNGCSSNDGAHYEQALGCYKIGIERDVIATALATVGLTDSADLDDAPGAVLMKQYSTELIYRAESIGKSRQDVASDMRQVYLEVMEDNKEMARLGDINSFRTHVDNLSQEAIACINQLPNS